MSNCYELVGYPEGSDSKSHGSKPPLGRGRGTVKATANVVVGVLSLLTPSASDSSTLFTHEQ